MNWLIQQQFESRVEYLLSEFWNLPILVIYVFLSQVDRAQTTQKHKQLLIYQELMYEPHREQLRLLSYFIMRSVRHAWAVKQQNQFNLNAKVLYKFQFDRRPTFPTCRAIHHQ